MEIKRKFVTNKKQKSLILTKCPGSRKNKFGYEEQEEKLNEEVLKKSRSFLLLSLSVGVSSDFKVCRTSNLLIMSNFSISTELSDNI